MKMSTKRWVSRWRGLATVIAIAVVCWGQPAAASTTIDIMIVYDTTATSWVASNGGMTAFSQDVVSRMNQAHQNSGIGLTFRLVHAMSVNYTTTSGPSSPLSGDLVALQGGTSAFAPVHAARDAYGADVVAMLVDHGSAYGYVGVAYLLSTWAGSPDYGFSVNAIRSVAISHTLTHEVGHNLGAHHSKNQASSPGPNPYLDNQYSAGWYFTGTNGIAYHTIMSYNNDGYGNMYQPAPLFSTPSRVFQGTSAGHAQDGDNARIIRETMAVVASYRGGVAPTTYPLGVSRRGTGAGTVSSSPAGINCGSTCAASFAAGTSVNLTATPANGSTFTGWDGACSGTGSCQVIMSQARNVAATFDGTTDPAVKLSNGVPITGLSGDAGSARYFYIDAPSGSAKLRITTSDGIGDVALYVSRDTRPTTDHWDCRSQWIGSEELCEFINPVPGRYHIMLDGNGFYSGVTLRATYTQASVRHLLTVGLTGDGSGTVISTPAGINCGSICAADFESGTSVVLQAMPATDSGFSGWGGACKGTARICTVSMTQARSTTAGFVLNATPAPDPALPGRGGWRAILKP